MARTRIAEFGTIQKLLAGATVNVYVSDTSGENTGVRASLYQAATGPALRGNPQVLDDDGKLVDDCWVEDYVMAEISNISERTQRELKKIRVNPLQYPLPLTSSSLNVSDASDAAATAVAAAATATTQAGISTTNAGLTAADRVQTGLDRVQTGSDLTNTTAQAVIATNAATTATAAAAGMNWKKVRAATTGALPTCTYNNGASGVGATLTASANGAFPSQDGVAMVVGNRLGVINQVAGLQNGVYTITNAGSAGTAWVLTRATDADAWTELVSQVILIEEGSTQAELAFICTVNTGGTIGTTAVVWSPFTMPIADGAVSTTAKLANGIVTFAKMDAASLATTAADIKNGVASLLVTAAVHKLWFDSVFPAPVVKAATGTSVLFSGADIISDPKEIILDYEGVRGTAADFITMQLGDSGGLETAGYTGATLTMRDGGSTDVPTLNGSNFNTNFDSSTANNGRVWLRKTQGNTWLYTVSITNAAGTRTTIGSGVKTLSDVLTQVSISIGGGASFNLGNFVLTSRGIY